MQRVNYASLLMSTRNTMFLFAFDWGLALDPNLDSGRSVWWWLAGHWIPAVFLSSEIHTTRAVLSHCGHFVWSPTAIISWVPPSSWRQRTFFCLISFLPCKWVARMICIVYNFLLNPLLTYTISFTSCLFYLEKDQLFGRFSPEDKRSSSHKRVSPHI